MTTDLVGTYRIQLRPDFGFREAAAIVPYLRNLGVSHLYLSPCFGSWTARSRARWSAGPISIPTCWTSCANCSSDTSSATTSRRSRLGSSS